MFDDEDMKRIKHHKDVISDLDKKYNTGKIDRAKYIAQKGRQIDNTIRWFREKYQWDHYFIIETCKLYGVDLLL